MNSLFYLFIVITFNSNFSYVQAPIDSLMIQLNEVNGTEQVDLLNQYSKNYMYEEIDLSNEFVRQAYRLSEQLDYAGGKGEALLNMGKIAFISGNTERAIQFFDSAHQLAVHLLNVNWMGDLYRWLARSHEKMQDLEKSISWYQAYFDFYQIRKDTTNMALALFWQGDLLHRLNRTGEARELYQQALHYFSVIHNQRGMFITWIKLTSLESDAGSPERAGDYLQRAEQVVQSISQPDLLISYFQVKGDYYKQIRPDSALYYRQQALTLASSNNKYFIRLSVLKEIAELYDAIGKSGQADHYNQEYSRLYDSLYHMSGLTDSDLSMYSLTDSIPSDIGAEREYKVPEDGNRTYFILLVAGAVLLIISFGYFTLNLYRLRKEKTISRHMAAWENEQIKEGPEIGIDKLQKLADYELKEDSMKQNISGFPEDQNEGPQEETTHVTEQAFVGSGKSDFSYNESANTVGSFPEAPGKLILVLDEHLNIRFASKSMCESLNYKKEALIGIPMDLVLNENEKINEKIFKQITEILEGFAQDESLSPIPVVLIGATGESYSFYAFLSLYEQATELLILLQFYKMTSDPSFPLPTKARLYLLPGDLKDYYELQGISKKKSKSFIFNQYLASLYYSLTENMEKFNLRTDGFSLGQNPVKYDYEEVSIFELYEPIKRNLSQKINDRIRFHEEIKNDEIHVLKKEWIIIIVYVLLKNAIEAITGSGDIYFISTVQRDHSVIRIIDTGDGIPLDLRNDVFEPFFTTRMGEENYGLGLSVAREIMKLQGGKMKIKSSYGKGTEIVLFFPMKRT